MMFKFTMQKALICGVAAACAIGCLPENEAPSDSREFGASGEGLSCYNPEGVNYALAGLAAATALELRRWNTAEDFRIVKRCGYSHLWWDGCTDVVELTSTGKARCRDGACPNVQAILDFQKKEATGQVTFEGGNTLQPGIFASRLSSNLMQQMACNRQPDNHDDANCPVEEHELDFTESAPGICETDYWFYAHQPKSSTRLKYPGQLKNQLLTFGLADNNPYLAFDWQGDDVKVDPGPGTVSSDPASSGSCPTLRSSGTYSLTNLSGKCCVYNSAKREFARSSFNRNYYLCR